jgi:hypothetical protein
LLIQLSSARSIPTNFGFVFQAGPIQVTDTTATESRLPANTSPTAIAHTDTQHIPSPSAPVHVPAPKRKRLVREEEDDQAWFQKRKKKTTKEEHTEHSTLAATTEITVDESHQEPPIEKKPTKRKVVRKRVLVPRSRQKASTKPQSEPQDVASIPLPEPEVETLPPPEKKKTRTKAPAVTKRKPKQPDTLDAPLPVQEKKQEPSNDPSPAITNPVRPKIAKPTRRLHDEKVANKQVDKILEPEVQDDIVAIPTREQPDLDQGTHQPPKKKKLVRRVRVPKVSTKRILPSNDDPPVNMADTHDTESAAPPDDVNVHLFETIAPAPPTKKAPKAPKRIFFNDDSDIDLDQMLSGIAAMAGNKTAAKAVTSKSSRVTRKKAAL